MATIKYPTDIDTDAEIPRVDDNITEIGGEAINQLRAAVFAIEKALGKKPQGTAADVAARLGVSLDSNGYIKASALSGIGLVTLPITNAQVGSAAGIEESKLDLNYGTTLLKSWIDSLKVRVDALEAAVALDIAHLAQHVAFPSTWGRHTTGDIDSYGVFTGRNAQGALTDLDTRLNAHVADPVDAHDGSAISLDATRFSTITATDVQSAAEQLEDLQLVEIIKHRDRQHGNGILGTQDAFVFGTKHGVTIIPSSTTTSGSAGDTFIKFSVAPSAGAFQSIRRNDRIDLTVGGKTYIFVIDGIQSTNQVNIFGSRPVAGTGTAVVYRNSEETSEPSVGAVCLRREAIGTLVYDSTSRPATLQVVHPTAPYILSNGFRGSDLSTSVRNIRLIYSGGDTYDMDVYTAMSSFFFWKSTWTAENVAKVMNASLLSPGAGGTHHPIVAFAYKGELGFAYDQPDANGYLTIGTVVGSDDATTTLGFVSNTTAYAMVSRQLYIDGYEIPSIKLLFDAYGQVTSSDTITFSSSANLLAAGVGAGHLAKVSVWATGTYVIDAVTANTLVFDTTNEYDFSTFLNKWLRVRIYADAFSLVSAPDERTLYEMFLDGYDDGYGPVAGFRTSARATYVDMSGTVASLEGVFDVTAVSRTLGSAQRRLFYNSTQRTVVLGDQVVGVPYISNLGIPVTMPSATPQGYRFTLYDGNGVDYFEFEVVGSLPVSNDGYLDITSLPRISEERFLQLATVLHAGASFKHLKDTRQFGNVGRQDVRDDFTRDYISYPQSLLRGNGVIYGFVASGKSTGTLTVTGGQALVNGQLKSVGKATFAIPIDGSVTYNLFMDTDGVLCLRRNDEFVPGFISTPGISELLASKTETALAQVVVVSNIITDIIDLRRFVNDIDSKLDLLVEENDITHGSFASLRAAVAYLSGLPSGSPISRRIKIKGEVFLSDIVVLPNSVVLEGSGPGTSGAKITYLSSTATIALGTGNTVQNLTFYRSGTLSTGFLSGAISGAQINRCVFQFAAQTTSNVGIGTSGLTESEISDCSFINASLPIAATNVLDSRIRYSKFQFGGQNAAYVAIGGTTFVRSEVLGCHFVSGGSSISFSTDMSGSRIEDNFFESMYATAIYSGAPPHSPPTLTWGSVGLHVINNMFTTGTTLYSGARCVYLWVPKSAIVSGNVVVSTATSAATGSMIRLEAYSVYQMTFGCQVSGNTLINSLAANKGFLAGIELEAAVLTTIFHHEPIVFGNYVENFWGATGSVGIHVCCAAAAYICNNTITSNQSGSGGSHNALLVEGSGPVQIVGNFITGTDSYPCVFVGNGTIMYDVSLIGNFVENYSISPPTVNLVHIEQPSPCFGYMGGVIANNAFSHLTGISHTRSLLYIKAPNYTVTGNIFTGGNYTNASYSAITFASGATSCMAVLNNLVGVTVGGSQTTKIYIANVANAVTDMLNKGQEYQVCVPIAYGNERRNPSDGLSSWGFYESSWVGDSANWESSASTLSLAFGENFVPRGATIKTVEIWYYLNGGDTTKMSFAWTRRQYQNTSSAVDSGDAGFADGSSHTQTLTPGTTLIMIGGEIHLVAVDLPSGSGGWYAIIYDMRVTYIL